MNDNKIKEVLERKDIPELSTEARERIIKTSVARFFEVKDQLHEPHNTSSFWIPAMAIAACVAMVFFTAHLLPKSSGNIKSVEIASNLDQNGRFLLQEGKQMFPEHFAGIKSQYGEVQFIVSENIIRNKSKPVIIKIKNGDNTSYVISYSGQTVPIEIDGKIIQIDILISGSNKVIIGSDKFLWAENKINKNTPNLEARIMEDI